MRRTYLLPLLAAGALLVTACGDDSNPTTDTTTTDTTADVLEDTSTPEDTTATDSMVADSEETDTLVEEDTTETDTMVEDTTEADTTVEDTTETDTTVEDTTETDTTVEDTTETDTTTVEDTTETDTTTQYDPSAQITAVRGGTAGAIEGAFVTYVKTEIGGDPAGFFVQGDDVGPALFIGVAADTLSPVPAVGDMVSFTVDDNSTETGNLPVTITSISGFSVLSSGNDVSTLVQDVSAATDLDTALDDYESELVTATVTLTGGFGYAGSGFLQADVDTAGVTGGDITFRMPTDDPNMDVLEAGCVVDVGPVPVWRYSGTAELSVDVSDDYEIVSCPVPELVSASAVTTTSVKLTFSRAIMVESVNTDGSDFTIDNGATVSAAAVDGASVTLTVSELAAGDYTVTVGAAVSDLLGTAISTSANSTTFTVAAPGGCASDLFFSEYAEGSSNNKLLEIANFTGASVDLSNYVIVSSTNGGGLDATKNYALSGTLDDGQVFVICNGDTDGTLLPGGDLSVCDATSVYPEAPVTFNGDDARGLAKIPDGGGDPVVIDIIGVPDNDPGAGWEVAGTADATKDHTIRRLSTVYGPNVDWATSAAGEWEVFDQNTFSDFGSHTYGGVCP